MIRFDPSELDRWADKAEAYYQLPDLVRRLILATVPGAEFLHMPGGSSVRMPGWDGLLVSESGNPWAPNGGSAWELSCEKKVGAKAYADYTNRTKDPRGVAVSQTTYVGVTARRWSGKAAWERKRRAEGAWAGVRALDAVDLVAWLEQAPAVAGWFARVIGKLPDTGWLPLDEWWEHWTTQTSPTILPELVVAGRQEQVDQVARWFQAEPRAWYIQGDTQEEAIAFLAAGAAQATEQWGPALFARALVVQTADAWRSLERHTSPLVLLRSFQDTLVSPQIAVSNGYHVLTPVDRSADLLGNGIALPSLGLDEAIRALTAMGLSENNARSLLRKSLRRLAVLRRSLQDEAGGQPPAWVNVFPSSLVALVLLGQWEEDHQGDTKVIASLVEQPYGQVERDLAPFAQAADAPLVKIGNRWRFVSHEEAWHLLAPRLTTGDVTRFGELATEMLAQVSPRFDLPTHERFLANVVGKVLPHSDTLREGVSRSVALMAVHPDRARLVESASYLSSRVVSGALAEGKDWQIWATLRNDLQTLAEAAPEAFLDAVEQALSADPSPFRDLFAQDENPLFAETPHAGLLWALERLAWSGDHFSRVAMALARLAQLDPRGSDANRPAESLRSLFLPWMRFSEATDSLRLQTIETIVKRHPGVGFKLILGAYSTSYVIDRPPPSWRPWGQDGVPNPTGVECLALIKEMDRMLLECVGSEAGRWGDLLGTIAKLLPETQRQTLQLLLERVSDLREDPAVGALWAKIRRELHRQRRYASSDWAMPQEHVAILDACYKGLTPSDPVAASAWLFDGQVALPDPTPYLPDDGVDHDKSEQQVAEAREAAIASLYQWGGDSAILALAEAAGAPGMVGADYVRHVGATEAWSLATAHLQSANAKLQDFAAAILRGLFLQSGWDALEDVLAEVRATSRTPEALAAVYRAGWPAGPETWDRLEAEDHDVQDAYWSSLQYLALTSHDATHVAFVVQRLVEVHRSLEAAHLLAMHPVSPESNILVLEQLHRDPSWQSLDSPGSASFQVAELLRKLDQWGDLPEAAIANLEIPYIGILHGDRPNLALYRQLVKEPSLFADLVSLAYRRSGGQADVDIDAHTRQDRATVAMHVLWNARGLPGLGEDGAVDGNTLESWVREARRLCSERGRADIGDEEIGKVLANAPVGADGVWPCEPVRDILDALESRHVGAGFVSGKHNLRGVVTKGAFGGGGEERSLADAYHDDATRLAGRWPFTAKLLREIAEYFRFEGHLFDREDEWHDQLEA